MVSNPGIKARYIEFSRKNPCFEKRVFNLIVSMLYQQSYGKLLRNEDGSFCVISDLLLMKTLLESFMFT